MAHFIPFLKSISREETTNVVMREVFRLHGLPDNIISDHGSQFVSKFWRHLLSLLKISRKVLSSSHHPQTNGKTTHINQTLEQYLCCLISHQQDDWIDILHFVEFAYNNSVQSSTKVTPFFAYTCYHPQWSFLELCLVSMNPNAKH